MKYLITGTSKGIGKELLKGILDSGHEVISISRTKTDFKPSDRWIEIQGDLTSDKTYKRVRNLLLKWDKLDVLVNNAGYLVSKPFDKLGDKDFSNSFTINVLAPARLIQISMPYLKKSNQGKVINISSIGGVQGSVKFPGLAFYSSSKSAIATLTECLAEEYKESSITFNCLALGAVQTEMLENAFPGYKAPVSAKQMADFIFNFILNSASMINGKIIPVSLTTP